jgi:hypothetical protein
MSTLTIQLPESLKRNIEALAAKEGYTVSQFLASADGEKLAVVLTMDYLRREAAAGRREDFEKYLEAVPDVPPPEHERLDSETELSSAARVCYSLAFNPFSHSTTAPFGFDP